VELCPKGRVKKVNPIIAMALGTVVLGEPLGARRVIAAGLVLCGVAIVTHRGRQ
jgi:drug/metabolite transporter (DMT)-like permease